MRPGAIYKDAESGCIVEFRMKDKSIAIATEECDGFAGHKKRSFKGTGQ